MTTTMLEQEFKYFLEHKSELINKYLGKYIVIIGDKVMGAYESEIEAYSESLKTHKIGTFLIQLCTPGTESYTHTFHSRAVFR
jgi:hypothetical protein